MAYQKLIAARLSCGFNRLWCTLLLGLPLALSPVNTHALPAKIIILRHGEKAKPPNNYGLCSVGWNRSQALLAQYLGKGALASLLPATGPAAIFAITPHSLELISPAAISWGAPVITFSAIQMPNVSKEAYDSALIQRTQQAAQNVMQNPRWNNKVVVMAWEHEHIANDKLVKDYPNQEVTLRQLLNLDKMPNASAVPTSWSGSNYDFFWIVTYGKRSSNIPTEFQMLQQSFAPPFASLVPSNGWGQPEDLSGTDCVQ